MVDIVQTQTDDNITVFSAENQLCMEKFVGYTRKEHTESGIEDEKHELLKSCNVLKFNTVEETEELSIMKCEERTSETIDKNKENQSLERESPELQIESPVSNDRSLEQFSEVLLDSDSSTSNHEIIANTVIDNKKDGKRVRFADEFGSTECDEGKWPYTI